MEALTIDCKTGRKTWRKLTSEELAAREIDVLQLAAVEEALQQKQDKRQKALERIRMTELGRDILVVLGIDT